VLQIQKERKKELRKLGHMVPYYTLMECTMVASPILAAIASFLTFAATASPDRFTPGAVFSAVALFGILKPPIEDLPHSMVEVRIWSVAETVLLHHEPAAPSQIARLKTVTLLLLTIMDCAW
jgi:hypothetical protein